MQSPSQIRFRGTNDPRRGFSLIEVLIVVAIIGIVAAITLPGLMRAKRSANEASAIGSLRALNSAESSYAASAGRGGYATLLATLATGCPGTPAAFISPDLALDPALKAGYSVSLMSATVSTAGPADCNGTATETAYYTTATPFGGPRSGMRAFASNHVGTIFFDTSGVPPTEAEMSPGGGGTTIQ